MDVEDKQSLRFIIALTSEGPAIKLTVHVPHKVSGPVQCRSDLMPFTAAVVRYRMELAREPFLSRIAITEEHFGRDKATLLQTAQDFLKNNVRKVSRGKAGEHLHLVQGIKASDAGGRKAIWFDADDWRANDVVFQVVGRDGKTHDLDSRATPEGLSALFDYLVGRIGPGELVGRLRAGSAGIPYAKSFAFGQLMTGTTVVEPFPEGLPRSAVHCRLTPEKFGLAPDLEALVDRANATLRTDAPGVWSMPDQPMLAPRHVGISIADPDAGTTQLTMTLCDSSYRYYAAFAFAELLARYQEEFAPLLEAARAVPIPGQPSAASCSIGVRVLLETADRRFIVAHRSDRVKLNPNVWSVSANEGVRRSLLADGGDGDDLLHLAAERALRNELRIEHHERCEPLLLSLYRNRFNQWGAGFWAKTDLSSADVMARQPKAIHHWEHRALDVLPVDIEGCGRAMRQLGTRWYGGALETICTVLAWRELASGQYYSAEEVGAALQRAAGGAIVPVDEANGALLPSP